MELNWTEGWLELQMWTTKPMTHMLIRPWFVYLNCNIFFWVGGRLRFPNPTRKSHFFLVCCSFLFSFLSFFNSLKITNSSRLTPRNKIHWSITIRLITVAIEKNEAHKKTKIDWEKYGRTERNLRSSGVASGFFYSHFYVLFVTFQMSKMINHFCLLLWSMDQPLVDTQVVNKYNK